MKRHGILSVTFNVPNDMISVVNSEGTLNLHPIQYTDSADDMDSIAHYNYINSLDGYNDADLGFSASYFQKKILKSSVQVPLILLTICMNY